MKKNEKNGKNGKNGKKMLMWKNAMEFTNIWETTSLC
jgi:hypothetical protein